MHPHGLAQHRRLRGWPGTPICPAGGRGSWACRPARRCHNEVDRPLPCVRDRAHDLHTSGQRALLVGAVWRELLLSIKLLPSCDNAWFALCPCSCFLLWSSRSCLFSKAWYMSETTHNPLSGPRALSLFTSRRVLPPPPKQRRACRPPNRAAASRSPASSRRRPHAGALEEVGATRHRLPRDGGHGVRRAHAIRGHEAALAAAIRHRRGVHEHAVHRAWELLGAPFLSARAAAA